MKHKTIQLRWMAACSFTYTTEYQAQMANETHFGILLHFSVTIFVEIKTMFNVQSEKNHHNQSRMCSWKCHSELNITVFVFCFFFSSFFPFLGQLYIQLFSFKWFKFCCIIKTNKNIFEENNYTAEQNRLKLLQNFSLQIFAGIRGERASPFTAFNRIPYTYKFYFFGIRI